MKILNKIIEENKIEEDFYNLDMGVMNDLSNVLDITLQNARGLYNKMKFSKESNVVNNIINKYNIVDETEINKIKNLYNLVKTQ